MGLAEVKAVAGDEFNAFITAVEPGEAGPGPLSGLRLAVKDLIDTAGLRTTYGSKIYADHVPERTASSAQKLLDAGAVLVGKAGLPEFAWSVIGQNQWYGTVHNPAHPGRTTGGSSSGSAAALAGGLCDIALGTDTGCSIRLPSACCETVGLKPRWGSIAMDGVFPLCPTLDTVGPMARSVEDVVRMWAVLTGKQTLEPRLAGLTVGLLRRPPSVGDGVQPNASDAGEAFVPRLQELGARVVEATIPEPEQNTWPLFFHEALTSHRATWPERRDDYSTIMQKKLSAAETVDPEEVAVAYKAVEAWRRYEPEVDLYVSPGFPAELPPEDCDELSVRIQFSAFLRPFNLLGWAGLAIGNMQLVAPHDETVLAAGLAWERG